MPCEIMPPSECVHAGIGPGSSSALTVSAAIITGM